MFFNCRVIGRPRGIFFLSQPHKWQESTSVICPSGGHCLSLGQIIGWIDPKVSLPLTAPVYNSKIRSGNNELTHGATNLQPRLMPKNVCHSCRHLFSVFTPGVYSVLSTQSYFLISIFFLGMNCVCRWRKKTNRHVILWGDPISYSYNVLHVKKYEAFMCMTK